MITKPKQAVETAKVLITDWYKEHLIGIYLDCRCNPLHVELVSLGTVNASLAHPREVFKPALVNSAVSVILLHNHPSGITDPSEDDLGIAKRLKEAGKILGIEFYDSIIFAQDGSYTSLKDKGVV